MEEQKLISMKKKWEKWGFDYKQKLKKQNEEKEKREKRTQLELQEIKQQCLPVLKQLKYKEDGEKKKDLQQYSSTEIKFFLTRYYAEIKKTRKEQFPQMVQTIHTNENTELYKILGDKDFENDAKRKQIKKEKLAPLRERKIKNLLSNHLSQTISNFYTRNKGWNRCALNIFTQKENGELKATQPYSEPIKHRPLAIIDETQELIYEKNKKINQQKQLTTLRTLNNFFTKITKKQIRAKKDNKIQQQLTDKKLNFYF